MMVAEHVEDPKLFKWAYTRAMRMLPLAWLPRRLFHNTTTGEMGTWALDRTQQGISRSGHVWRVFAELSQTAAYMSVSNPSIASTISSKAYSAYVDLFVDKTSKQRGVLHWKDYITHEQLFAKGKEMLLQLNLHQCILQLLTNLFHCHFVKRSYLEEWIS